jgi:Alw26I/Eco31I/Esp3I family type II restriction m6 adenine DNA methyltransferase
LSEGAVLSFIVPSTLIADKNTSGIRKLFKQEGTLDFLIEFPEKEHVFQSVTQATTVFLYRNIKSSQKFKLSVGLSSSALPPLEHAELSWSEVEKMSGESLTLPLIKSPDDLEVIENIKIGSVDLQNLAKCYKGDINLGYFKSQLSDEPASHLLIRGEHIQPYFVNLSTSDVDRRWIALETELPGAAKARIACQNVANMGLKQRINAGFVPEGVIVADSCNCVEPLDSRVDEYFLLGLLNSKLMNWYFKKFSTNNHVNVYELETLPVRVPSTEQLQRLSNLVRQITGDLGPSSLSVGAETSLNNQQVLDEIDAEVYRLYNLAESEIVIVEREF